MTTLIPVPCPECGALSVEGLNCWEMLGGIIAWEGNDPDLSAVHFLTVASYNLQHPAQFTDDALVWLRKGFIDYLDNRIPTHVLRKRASSIYEGKKRVLKPERDRKPVFRRWPLTIDHVYLPDQPEGAADRVRQWANVIRKEL